MRVEITPRQFSIRVYGDDPTDYIASAQVLSYGDRCSIYSICGKDFYTATPMIMDQLEAAGMRVLEGYASRAHARLLRMVFKKHCPTWEVKEDGPGVMFGHELIWIRITKKEPE